MKLTRPPKTHMRFGGRKYKLNLRFDNVLNIFELQKAKDLSREDKIDLTCEMLIGRSRLSLKEKALLIEQVFRQEITQRKSSGSNKKAFDFHQDAGYIYASFVQAYGIDLHQTEMHWEVFMSLFEGLPADTVIKEIISIRLKPMPKATKYNAEEIKALQESKRAYALKIDPDEARQSFQDDIDRFALMVRGR